MKRLPTATRRMKEARSAFTPKNDSIAILENPLYQVSVVLCRSCADESLGWFAALEDDEGGYAHYSKLVCNRWVVVYVQLRELGLAIVLCGEFFHYWRHELTRSAPVSVEIHDHYRVLLHYLLEGLGVYMCYSGHCHLLRSGSERVSDGQSLWDGGRSIVWLSSIGNFILSPT